MNIMQPGRAANQMSAVQDYVTRTAWAVFVL